MFHRTTIKALGVVAASVLLLAGCSSLANSPETLTTSTHQTVAVLPVEIYVADNAPAWLAGGERGELAAESLSYQEALFRAFAERTAARYPDFDLQSVEETRARLAAFNLDPRAVGGLPTHTLADILGVDAVIRTEIEKLGTDDGQRYDVASLLATPAGLRAAPGLYAARCALIDGLSDETVWEVAVRRQVDWGRPASDVIAAVARELTLGLFGPAEAA